MIINKCTYTDVSNHIILFLSKTFRSLLWQSSVCLIREGADKSLARPGRKQATATKLGIYSTYSPRSSLHILALCSNFCKPLQKKKKIQNVVRPTRSPRQQWPPLRKKNGELSIVFSVQGTGGSPTGPDPENRVGDPESGILGRPVSSGLQVSGEPGRCRARTRPPWWPSRGVFLQNVLQLHQQRWVILRVDSLALWKINNEEDAVLIPKNRGENFSSGFLNSDFLGAGLGKASRYAATLLIVALSPGHSDITRFRPWLPIAPDRKSFG